MDDIIRFSKKLIQDLKLQKISLLSSYYNLNIKVIRVLQCRILLANQIKIGNRDLCQRIRMKYVEALGEVAEEINEHVQKGINEQFYIELCDVMKKSLIMFDCMISSI